MSMISARKLHEGRFASDVALVPQQNEHTPSVSLCIEELAIVQCPETECRGQVWLSPLCKEGPKKPDMIMLLYKFSKLKFQMPLQYVYIQSRQPTYK